MATIENSKFLESIIEKAKTYTEEGNVTIDTIFLAMMEFVENVSGPELTSEQIELKRLISENVDLSSAAKLLHEEIKKKKISFIDNINYQKLIKEASEQSEKSSLTELRADILAQCIVRSPSNSIKTILNRKSDKPALDVPLQKAADISETHDKTTADEKTEAPEPEKEESADPLDKLRQVEALVKKTKQISDILSKKLYGQNNAIATFVSGYFQSLMLKLTGETRNAPGASFLFAGPPGVGKTFLAESVAEVLELPYKRFDMSEYSDHEANMMFCGYDNVYKNAAPGHVTSFVEENPKCILLFDEIEKCHLNVIHLFLQLLDAGRLKDNYTRKEVSFKDAIIILTTNAGREIYENSDSGDFSDIPRKVILKTLQSDINPVTGAPFFPGAICSRFATGNVVMFNRMDVTGLSSIVKKEMSRNADNIAKSLDVKLEIDENIYTAVLFAEGGGVDARTARSRAQTFIDKELFELFRLMTSEASVSKIEDVKKISFSMELPKENKVIYETFNMCEKPEALVFASSDVESKFEKSKGFFDPVFVDNIEKAKELLTKRDIKFVLIDFSFGGNNNIYNYLNIEDVYSAGRDFLREIRENYKSVPAYIIQTETYEFSPEERVSLLHQGARDIIELEPNDTMTEQLAEICRALHRQQSMYEMTSRGKVLTFETAQTVSKTDEGLEAEIKLFDFRTVTAVDAEDNGQIVNNLSRPNTKFDDVIGADDVKEELRYFAEYMKNPRKYAGTGLRAPRGILLYGPPGTGKTLMAKALAGESDTTFISAEGNQFLKKYVGEGPEAVHRLFRTARKYAPSILFIDEIDAIGKSREGEGGHINGDILTAFLAEMDGFSSDPSKPVFVLAATNYDVDPESPRCIDPALLRRFDRKMYVDLPKKEERKKYLDMKLAANKAFSVSDAAAGSLANRSIGMSLAELESVLELALRSAVRTGSMPVTDKILDDAFETFNSGERKEWSEEIMLRTARHESGHTLMCRLTGEKPSYVTIVSRGNFGGYMQHADNEEKSGYTKKDMFGKIRTALGGRAAEIVYYGNEDGISTGASSDLSSATRMATSMLCRFGMIEEFGMGVLSDQELLYSPAASEVRSAVNKILNEQLEMAVMLISAHRDCIDALSSQLLANNHLNTEEIDEIIGRFIDLSKI